jgi:hypothetical protein
MAVARWRKFFSDWHRGRSAALLLQKTWLLDIFWLIGLAAYVLIGVAYVPFHGDESTLTYMSHDYYDLVQKRDIDPVLYRDHPRDPSDQKLRIINGTVGKMAMGFAWDMAGLTVKDLNQPWDWGAPWDWNLRDGHKPGDDLLRAARWSSALLLVLGVWALFGIVRLTEPHRIAAYAASALYVTTSAVLLNGRRAMFEGSHLGFALLAVLAATYLVKEQGHPAKTRRKLLIWSALFGALSGVAVASKHTAVITIGVAYLAVITDPLIWPGTATLRQRIRSYNLRRLLRFALIPVLGMLVFLALNPAWWSNPLTMPDNVLVVRRNLLNGQAAAFGDYQRTGEGVKQLVNNAFFAHTQYYEADRWQDYIADEIAAYDGQWYAGRGGGLIGGAALIGLFAAGLVRLIPRWREDTVWLALISLVGTALALLMTVPMNWQRYYLPLHAPVAVVAGIGLNFIIQKARRP